MSAPPQRQLPLTDHPFAIGILALSGTAAALALQFALAHKPWVVLHTLAGYALIWGLLVSYGIAYRARRRLLAIVYWLTALVFTAVLTLIHLDDMPAATFWNDSLDPPVLGMRPEVPSLGIAALLNCAWVLLLTIHALWLQLRRRRIPAAAADDSAGDGQPAPEKTSTEVT